MSEELFWSLMHLHGGPAPVRRFLPQLMDLVWTDKIKPGKVFDLDILQDQVAEGYKRWTNVAPSRRSASIAKSD